MSTKVSAEVAERMRRVIGSFVRVTRAHTQTMKSAESDTLDILARQGPLTIAGLAQSRRVRHQSMRVTITQLEAQGAIRRGVNPGDARSQLITLTQKGRSAVLKGQRLRSRWLQRALSETFTAEETACLTVCLGAMERLVECFPVYRTDSD